jgi:hypothetical protein
MSLCKTSIILSDFKQNPYSQTNFVKKKKLKMLYFT